MMDISIRDAKKTAPATVEELYRLHTTFFCNGSREIFFADFYEKDYVIIALDDSRPAAFSTIRLHDEYPDGERTLFLFSGDTIVHPEYWHSNVLVPAFAAFLNRQLESQPGVRLFWYLITKGHRTYMFLPVLFREFYPTPDRPTPPAMQSLLDYISEKRFGRYYNKKTGLISYSGGRDYLAAALSEVPAGRGCNRYIRFFLTANPGYTCGDELACLTAVRRDNIKPAGLKLLDYRDVRWEI